MVWTRVGVVQRCCWHVRTVQPVQAVEGPVMNRERLAAALMAHDPEIFDMEGALKRLADVGAAMVDADIYELTPEDLGVHR